MDHHNDYPSRLTTHRRESALSNNENVHSPASTLSFRSSSDQAQPLTTISPTPEDASAQTPPPPSHHSRGPYRTYPTRWFGLFQLTLLNIIVSWDWLTYAPVAQTTASYMQVSVTAVNWLSTGFLFAFLVATPVTMYTLSRGGPKHAIVAASVLLLVGNWIRYGASRGSGPGSRYGVTMFGQILVGLAQPFVLCAPTSFSDMWFGERGRIVATAIASLANPFGGALGQLIDPLWATKPSDVPNMVLYVAIISTVATIPSLFIPRQPPTPPTPTSAVLPSASGHQFRPTPHRILTLFAHDLTLLLRNPSFLLLFLPFTIYVTAFNALSTLLTSILTPYGFTEEESGLTGGLLIIVGLISSAVSSPLLDRRPALRLPFLKVLAFSVPVLYTAFVFAPQTRGVAAPYAVAALLGAASFCLVPLALELLVEVTYEEVGAEVSSCTCWAGGQLGGGVVIVVMDALRGSWEGGEDEPRDNMKAGLVLLAVMCWVVMPCALVLGFWGLGRRKREEAAKDGGGWVGEPENGRDNEYSDRETGR
ncbi:MAG: hypothetical protein M1831_003662 [Alyxoria varia]|nr:MAG: hypothetical protein M1831_003662 [Alyxoria varia]